MDLLRRAKKICRQYNIKLVRNRGQNFLINKKVCDRIIKAADLSPDDIVLEVGPGLGFLTVELACRAKRVMAVEVDEKLADVLRESLEKKKISGIRVINGDILKLIQNSKIKIKNSYKIVANLPYNITSIFLRKFLTISNKPSLMVLMLQKEVAERICAQPPAMSLLAVSVRFYAEPQIIGYVSRDDFWPQPEVDSAIVKFKIQNSEFKFKEDKFFQLVKFGFSARRKMLKNNLAAGYHILPVEAEKKLKLAGLSEKVRAQELSVEDWGKLFEIFR